ncbi:MAG: hypothetical protein IPK85_11520 [Gemmatimonadetes bacterium]|nr:hypothetical protein [Gemmatimonadota bacterium]
MSFSQDPRLPEADDMYVRRTLVSHYSAPSNPSYWEELEARVMARVRGESGRDWSAWLSGWARYGLAAAAAAIIVIGVASWQTRAAQERLAVRELLDTPAEIPLLSEVVAPVDRDRNQTLRYLLTH